MIFIRIQLNKKYSHGGFLMKEKIKYSIPVNDAGQKIIEERAISLAQYIIDSKDTVRGAAKKFCISKSTVHMDVTLQNGKNKGQPIPESIEIKEAFLSTKKLLLGWEW